MILAGYTDDGLRVLHAQATARYDVAAYTAAQVTLDCLRLAGDDAAWHEADGKWHVLMAVGDEAKEMMDAITSELERRSDERSARHDR